MSVSEGVATGGDGGGSAAPAASSAPASSSAAPASADGGQAVVDGGQAVVDGSPAGQEAPASQEASEAPAVPETPTVPASPETEAVTSKWSGELASLETLPGWDDIDEGLRAQIKGGLQTKIRNLEAIGTRSAEAAKADRQAAARELATVQADRAALQREITQGKQELASERKRLREMLINPPEDGDTVVAQAKITEEAAAQLTAAQAELAEVNSHLTMVQEEKAGLGLKVTELTTQLAQAQAQAKEAIAEAVQARTEIRQVAVERLEEVIRQVDADILAEGNEAAFDELTKVLNSYAGEDGKLSEEAVSRAVKMVRAIHPTPGAPADVPASMKAMAGGGAGPVAGTKAVDGEYHEKVKRMQREAHDRARAAQ